MKLEKAIKQTDFKNHDQKLTLTFLYTYNCFINSQKSYFVSNGITQQQYNVLRILRGNHPEPYSTAQIRDRMLDKMSDASRIVDRLVKKNLVKRTISTKDKRLVDVVISDKGLRLLSAMDKTIVGQMKKSFKTITKEDKQTLIRLLNKLRG